MTHPMMVPHLIMAITWITQITESEEAHCLLLLLLRHNVILYIIPRYFIIEPGPVVAAIFEDVTITPPGCTDIPL